MKRANGTGSVVRLSGRRRRPWAVRVSCRDEAGRTVQRAISYHARAADAQSALEEYNRAHRVSEPAADMTVAQAFAGWSAREYRKLSKGSITSHNAALIKALNRYAMERDAISKDYSAYLDIPQAEIKHPRGALTDRQVEALARLAAAGVPYSDTALMLCYTGFRINEFLSLTRASYHEEGNYLQGGLKTQAGRERIVPVHPRIAPYLAAWLEKGGAAIVCRSDGKALRDSEYRRIFAGLMARIGAEGVTPHWCRHTFATRLHAAGVDPLTVKWLMGHSTRADITAHYTHRTLEVLRSGIQRLP